MEATNLGIGLLSTIEADVPHVWKLCIICCKMHQFPGNFFVCRVANIQYPMHGRMLGIEANCRPKPQKCNGLFKPVQGIESLPKILLIQNVCIACKQYLDALGT